MVDGIAFQYLAKIVNVKTAFLYGDLEKEIYVECSHGMSNIKKDAASFSASVSMALFKQQGSTTKRLLRF